MNVTARFTFDAAHRILGHPGKCAYVNASGPTWVPFIVYLSKLYASHLYPAVRSLWPEGSGLRGIADPS